MEEHWALCPDTPLLDRQDTAPFLTPRYTPVAAGYWLCFRWHSSAPRPFCLFFIRSNSLKQWKLWELAAVCKNTVYSTSVFRPYKFLPYGCLLLASPDTAHTQKDPWKHWSQAGCPPECKWEFSLLHNKGSQTRRRKVLSCCDAAGFRLPWRQQMKPLVITLVQKTACTSPLPYPCETSQQYTNGHSGKKKIIIIYVSLPFSLPSCLMYM